MKNRSQLDLFRQVVPLPPHDRSHGLLVQMPTPCRCCAALATIGEGRGPHAAAMLCVECDVHRGWVSHATHKFLIELINKFGRPTEPIVLLRGRQPSARFTCSRFDLPPAIALLFMLCAQR
jgi:hypothetical protein